MAFQKGALGRPTEALQQCPYDKNHFVAGKKFNAHLGNCRKRFQMEQLKSGGQIDVFVCQHNPSHVVYEPELIFHESGCSDRDKIYSHQLNVAQLRQSGLPSCDDVTSYARDEKDSSEMFLKDDLGMIHGAYGFGRKYFMDTKDGKRASQRWAEENGRKLEEEMRAERKKAEKLKEEAALTAEEKAEIERWNTFASGPGFDYMANVEGSHHSWLLRYPPSLTKAERREFEKKQAAELLEEQKERSADVQTPSTSTSSFNAAEWV